MSVDNFFYQHLKWTTYYQPLQILNITQSSDKIEFQLSEEISNKINGEKLFLEAYNVNPKFRLKYHLKRITITLPIINLEKHYIYYLVELLDKIADDIN